MAEPLHLAASWYDGQSAIRHEGEAIWAGGTMLRLSGIDGAILDVNTSELRHLDTHRDEQTFALEGTPDFRLTLHTELPTDFLNALPAEGKYGGWVDRIGLGKATVAFAGVSAVALAVFLTAPEWLGPMVPESWERQMGEAMVGDFGNRVCHTPEGDAALAKLVAATDPSATPVRAGVANIDMVNAVALPGGQVLLFNGLLQEAEDVSEVAGVLAHEVGHVRERHVMTAVLRQFGLSILASGFNSGVAEGAFGIASMGYSRDAEREADEFARARMVEADISPLGAAGFFERLSSEFGDDEEGQSAVVGWVASHPASGERAKAFRASHEEGRSYRSILTEAEFDALLAMCDEDEDVEKFDFFF